MSALKWNRWCSGAADCRVGLFCVTAYARATPRLVVSVLRDHGRECSSLDEAIDFAEKKLRDMLTDLQRHFAPVLRWTADEARLLDCWVLSIGKRDDGLYWWSTMLGDAEGLGSFGMDGDDCESADEARRAAEAALRSLGVVFRVEGE